jgi:hypothetical protein
MDWSNELREWELLLYSKLLVCTVYAGIRMRWCGSH